MIDTGFSYRRATLACVAVLALTAATAMAVQAAAPSAATGPIIVTTDNFVRAETDLYFSKTVQEGLGKFFHIRELAPIDNQTVIRMNRDTLYSSAVFDLDAGPVTVTLPDAGSRFMSMMALDQDEYVPVPVVYGAGLRTYTREQMGTRYMMLAVRTLVDPKNPADLAAVHALQDAIMVIQTRTGSFEVPNWDHVSQDKVRSALLALGAKLPNSEGMFGARNEVDPLRHLIGAAMAWGGNPTKDALYLIVTPPNNDGVAVYGLTVGNVPVDGFWSVTLYNAEGYFTRNPHNAYSVNNIIAANNGDGSVAVQFGGCDGRVPNCLPTVPGWNYTVRLYRPRPEILNGTWKFPPAEQIGTFAAAPR